MRQYLNFLQALQWASENPTNEIYNTEDGSEWAYYIDADGCFMAEHDGDVSEFSLSESAINAGWWTEKTDDNAQA